MDKAWMTPLVRPLHLLLDFALPPRCAGCGAIVGGPHQFCLPCWGGLVFLDGPACRRCGIPFERELGEVECGACLAAPPPQSGTRAALAYGGAARSVALRLKHGRRPGLAETMARLMARHAPDEGHEDGGGWMLAPVPLHRWRLWRRGYNQSALIARALGRRTGHAVDTDLIRRIRATPMLGGLNPRQRADAVRGVFRAAPRAQGLRVVLIDDVYTTGATARACAAALLRAGAVEVRVLCWARVPEPSLDR